MKGKKGFNAQAFFTEHAEKIGFGLIGLMVVGIWASEFFGGAWAREKRNPAEMTAKIKETQASIERGVWPEEKRSEFALVDYSDRAATLLRPINASRYEFSTELFVPLNRPKEKAREPDLLAVEDLSVIPGHVILSLSMQPEDLESEDDEEEMLAELEDDEEVADRFKRRDNRGQGGAAGNALGAGPAGAAGMLKMGRRGDDDEDGPVLGNMKGMMPQDMLRNGNRGGMGTASQKPAGYFFVAVRGVWPINAQLEKIRRALHLPNTTAARDYLDILDFELERQVAVRGDDPWSGAWEMIKLDRATEILKEVDGFDEEPLDMAVFDPVITMSLPMRALGYWTDEATHPRIKNYELSPEAKERERVLTMRFMEQKEKMKLDESKLPRKGGFAALVNDFRGMANQMGRVNPNMMQNMYGDMAKEMRTELPNMGADLTPEQLKAKITAVGQLLLFRYFDFDVQPGFAYRYRVRLKLRNPNFEREVTEVADPSVAEGPDRMTPFSEPSDVAILKPSPRYFLHNVDRNPLAEEGRGRRGLGTISMFEWHRELGTHVAATLALESLGQFIGGLKDVEVLDVGVPELRDQEYPFSSEDMLVDVKPDAEVLAELHPDLGLPLKKKPIELGLVPEAIVLDRAGELIVLEGGKATSEERKLKRELDAERKPFEGLKKDEEAEESPLDQMPFGTKAAGDPAEEARGNKGKRKATANPRRKGGGSGGVGAMPYGASAATTPGGGYQNSSKSSSKSKKSRKSKRGE